MALVVTIIIMLILAGVALNAVLGDNGLINQAKKAAEKYQAAQQEEENTLLDIENGMEEFEIKEQRNKLKIGDYVVYEPEGQKVYSKDNLGVDKTGYENGDINQEELQYQVLRIHNGEIDLIGKPTQSMVTLKGITGYTYGVDVLNDICAKLYSRESANIIARSVKVEDIENWLTEKGKSVRDSTVTYTTKYGESKTYNGISSLGYPTLYKYEVGSGIDTDIAKSNGLGLSDSIYKLNDDELASLSENEGKSSADEKITVTQTYYGLPINNENIKEETVKVLLSPELSYYVASRFALCYDEAGHYGYWGIRFCEKSLYHYSLISSYGMYTDGYPNACSSRLRPIVTLSANAKLSIQEGTEENPHTIISY